MGYITEIRVVTPAERHSPRSGSIPLAVARDVFGTLQSALTIVGIIAAAWWFLFRAESAPKLTLEHAPAHYKLTEDWVWVYVAVEVTNLGERPVRLSSERVWLQKVLPVDPSIQAKFARDEPVINADGDVDWPLIGQPFLGRSDVELYPQESHSISYEFLIPSYVTVVRIYSFYQKQGSERGWQHSSLYDIHLP
jgi:hypothetical protein